MPKFQKGQSGNPGGRPKLSPEIKLALEQVTPLALATLQSIMTDERADEEARIKAATALLDRGLGKPTQGAVWDEPMLDGDGVTLKSPEKMSITELLRAIRLLENNSQIKTIELSEE